MKKKKINSTSKCKVCGYDPIERPSGGMMKHKKDDRRLAEEYAELSDNHGHTVKPIWKKCCGALSYYRVILKDNNEPFWKRNIK